MKKLYLIGGTMGCGKTTICKILNEQLPNSVFLDGDWCWQASPFIINEETKGIVIDNITYLLNNFITSKTYENIIFGWVMHEQAIIDDICNHLKINNCKVIKISLIINKENLIKRLKKDIRHNLRQIDIIERSISYLPKYENLNTIKIDTNNQTPNEIVQEIIKL